MPDQPRRGRLNAPGCALASVALLVAVAGLLLVARGTPVEGVRSVDGDPPPAPAEAGFVPLVEALVPTRLEAGHAVELLNDGDGTFARLFGDLRAARESIVAQVYYWKEGALADSIAAILTERARAGVRVHLLFDDFGADVPDAYRQRLTDAGVVVARLRPVSIWALRRSQERSHIRAVVVDGRVGYTGGFGIDDAWLGDGRTRGQWRESNVRFTGPAVAQLTGAFAAGWAEATGVLMVGTPRSGSDAAGATAGDASIAGLVFTSPTNGSTPAERLLALSIVGARERLWIANAYFVPDDDFRAMLIASARRGVDVRVLVPSADTDVPVVRLAARAHYRELLDGGVRIFEYQPTMMHAKTIVADGAWCLVGTMNLDNRSLALNDEVTLAALDGRLGAAMERSFLADLEHSQEITVPEFERRGAWEKLREKGAVLLSRWL
ncbi:MAG TPA: phospholipase D-like domain-containing protein [Longimicrobiales bacterium]